MRFKNLLHEFFRKAEDGYVIIMSLLAMPIFVGFGLIIIDIGRGNNAQADLQAAADAIALAGARELDGSAAAIDNARDAMEEIANSVSMLEATGDNVEIALNYSGDSTSDTGCYIDDPFQVCFLIDIPADDDDPIDEAWLTERPSTGAPGSGGGGYATSNSFEANYVWVKVQSVNLQTTFLNPANLIQPNEVEIAAIAVAKSVTAACDITPMYICNPFEPPLGQPYTGNELQEAYDAGRLHGRLLNIHPKGSSTESAGNFGFLQVPGVGNADTTASKNALREILAGRPSEACFDSARVATNPGNANAVRQGLNTRMDIYEGSYGSGFINLGGGAGRLYFPPAENVRKGYDPDDGHNDNERDSSHPDYDPGGESYDYCGAELADSTVETGLSAFPPNDCMVFTNDPTDDTDDVVTEFESGACDTVSTADGAAGADVGFGDWDIDGYFAANYGLASAPGGIPSSFPSAASPGASVPSRYDVYRWEIQNAGLYNDAASPAGETGAPQCGPSIDSTELQPESTLGSDPAEDRRVLQAAFIDCQRNTSPGASGTRPVTAFASVFLVAPMEQNSGTIDPPISLEVIDITGYGGTGTLDTYVREEAILVR